MVVSVLGKTSPTIVGSASRCRSATLLQKNSSLKHWQSVRINSTFSLAGTSSIPSVAPPPLAALPTGVLLRSLLVATISSKPFLLLPCLSVLSALCKPSRGALLNVDRNVILHSILKRTFYNQFCAGETGAETKDTLRRFKDMGFRGTILTYAKETVFDSRTNTSHAVEGGKNTEQNSSDAQHCPSIEAWRKGTLETVDLLGENDYLALKYVFPQPFACVRDADDQG
jgi:hypothetical protein